MSSKEVKVSRSEGNDPKEGLKAYVEAQLAAAIEQKTTTELAQTGVGNPANLWEVFAWGPYQYVPPTPAAYPGRIIMVGEEAYIAAAVWLNDSMLADLVGFGAHIELNFFTSNVQTMQPLQALDYRCCVYPVLGQYFYVCVWELEPTIAACLYETNICARVCSCNGILVPDYAAFVRHVFDFDYDNLFPTPPTPSGFQFDRPIRYLVAERGSKCECPPTP